MKNIIYILACVFLLAACEQDDSRIFEKSSGQRSIDYVAQSYSALVSSPNGWKMTYFPNDALYGGYNFLFKFAANDRVEMASEFGSTTETSSYRVNMSSGPLLVFDSYNYIHILSDPQYVPRPVGLRGDYEFVINGMDADAFKLIGRRFGVKVTMEKASAKDWTDIVFARDFQRHFRLFAQESWQLSMKGEKVPGSLSLDTLYHTYAINYEDISVRGQYTLTPTELKFNQPVSIQGVTFSGLKVQYGATFQERKIVSNDAVGAMVFTIKYTVPVTPETITTYIPDPDGRSIEAFMNLKNNGTMSRYRITLMSERVATWYNNFKELYPTLVRWSIQAPRSSYQLSVVTEFEVGSAYANCTNGFTPMTGEGFNPLNQAVFAHSGNSTSSAPSAPPTGASSNTNWTSFRSFVIAATGFTIIQDGPTVFWFRSNANPDDWFKTEAY